MSILYPMATHNGQLRIGSVELECHVLDDGQRVFSSGDLLKAFNLDYVNTPQKSHTQIFTTFLDRIRFYSFSNQDLSNHIQNPVLFRMPAKGGHPRRGYPVELLPEICSAILKQADPKAKSLPIDLYPAADQARMLLSAFAKVGIVALVDEATGYQRDMETLQGILDKYLAKEQSAWAKRFPDEFYKEMFRLKNWQWRGMKVNRPGVVGTYTKEIVYNRLAPGLLDELERLNPTTEDGRRKARHHQWLSPDIGHPELNLHLFAVTKIMKTCSTWEQFKRKITQAFPRSGDQGDLFFDDDE